jgi:cytochrome c oxidase cbb3-type subunit III
MRHLGLRRLSLFILAGWVFWTAMHLIVPDAGRSLGSAQAFAASEKSADGSGVYRQFCVNCHGANGKGDDNMRKVMTALPDFTSDKWQKEITDPQMLVSITDGKGTLMPAFVDKVNSDQVQELVEYIRKFDPARRQ